MPASWPLQRAAPPPSCTTQSRSCIKFLGIDWVGVNGENARKLLLSLAFVVTVILVSSLRRTAPAATPA